MDIRDAQVVLHLHIRVKAEQQPAFFEYVRTAFPLFEERGDCQGAVYVSAEDPEAFDEVFYYRDEAAYQAGEQAIANDPRQVELLEHWRSLLVGVPRVEVFRRV